MKKCVKTLRDQPKNISTTKTAAVSFFEMRKNWEWETKETTISNWEKQLQAKAMSCLSKWRGHSRVLIFVKTQRFQGSARKNTCLIEQFPHCQHSFFAEKSGWLLRLLRCDAGCFVAYQSIVTLLTPAQSQKARKKKEASGWMCCACICTAGEILWDDATVSWKTNHMLDWFLECQHKIFAEKSGWLLRLL